MNPPAGVERSRPVLQDGQTVSVWMATQRMPQRPPLESDAQADVCIVGAGIAGLLTAYFLMKAGSRPIVLDDGPIAGGETQRTSAHLSAVFDGGFSAMERLHGREDAALAFQSHSEAVDSIERIVREEGIDCDFARVDGYLFSAEGERALEEEFRSAAAIGVPVEWTERLPVDAYRPGRALRFPNQAQFHPLKFLARLSDILAAGGCPIHTSTHVEAVEAGETCVVRTAGGHRVLARSAVVAANSPFVHPFLPHVEQAAYRTYVVGFRLSRPPVRRALFWDTEDPYHYVRFESAGEGRSDILLAGGEDHKTGQADDADARFLRLESWARKIFPAADRVEYRWSGQVLETIDHLAFIGRSQAGPGVYIATGDCGMGLTHGTIAGLLLRDLILGRENPWQRLYDPSRKPLKAAKTFLRENANVAARYAGWFTDGDVRAVDVIPRGQGAVVRSGLRKIAAYRDDDGVVHAMTAVCPHMGCIVDWNSAEKTWDCPCHGSRFDRLGGLLNGPSNVNLGPAPAQS